MARATKQKARILTRHPEGKKGFRVSKQKYEKKVMRRFEGSIPWYVEVVKLDLEARKIIERISGCQPQKYRLGPVSP